MAITTIYTYPLNGTQRDFTIPFEYLARRFVVVTLIGANRRELTLTADFRFLSKTLVQLNKAWGPSDGYERIEIRRNTSATDRLVDFADGSILRAAELNTSQVQTLHVAEEARNMVADTISTNSDGDLDARGRRLVNLADATEPGHAVTLRQEQGWAGSALASSQAAKTSENAAKVSETNSKTSENAAKVSETNSKTSENAAKVSETNAAGYAAGLNLPSASGGALKVLRQNAAETGLEYVHLDPWALQPIGVPIPVMVQGTTPPTTSTLYRYIALDDDTAYNGSVLTSVSKTGADPKVISTAVISLVGSPLDGVSIRLINDERRFLRPGKTIGALEEDMFAFHAHGVNDPGHAHALVTNVGPAGNTFQGDILNTQVASNTGPVAKWTNSSGTGISIQSNGGNETRPRSFTVRYFLRVK